MNKKVFPAILIEVLAIVFYLIVVFIVPFTYNKVFFVNIIITVFGLLAISAVTDYFLSKYVKKSEAMFVVPIIKYSTIVGVLYIISSFVFIVSRVVPMWVQVLSYLVYTVIYFVLIIVVSSIKNKSVSKLEEVKTKTSLNVEWIARLNVIIKKSDNVELKASLEPLISILKHGESVSKPQLAKIEERITNEISIMEELLNKGKIDGVIIECSVLNDLLIERRELTSLYN